MDYFKPNKSDIFSLEVDDTTKSTFLEMSRWTKFLAVFGFVCIGLIILLGLFMAVFVGRMASGYTASLGILGGNGLALIYLLLAAVYVYPTYALYKYSTGMKYALGHNDKSRFDQALRSLKNMFKYMGILMIVCICAYGVAIIAVIIFAAGKI